MSTSNESNLKQRTKNTQIENNQNDTKQLTDKEKEELVLDGVTDEGEKFHVPDTLSTVNIFHPSNIGIVGITVLVLILSSLYSVLFMKFSKWFHIFVFLFFRCSYDIGLGIILSKQSRYRWFTKLYLRLRGEENSKAAYYLDYFAAQQLHADKRSIEVVRSYPIAFRAWLVYKNLVTIILCNDGIQYLILGIKCFHAPTEWFSFLTLAQYGLGLALGLFNYWAKVDAHRCIGEYCWYWGDFFFRRNSNLTFDGIFELFPHPMYTVGYSLYYGYSLICRSYTMFFISLLAHAMQIAFLFFVEEPHIERMYGSPPNHDKNRLRWLYDPKSGWFPGKRDSIFLVHLDLFRSADFSLLVMVLYAIYTCIFTIDSRWLIAQVVVWRFFHTVVLGYALWTQSERQAWSRHFLNRGRSLYEAFAEWKKTYNISLTMNIIVFIGCAARYIQFNWHDLADPSYDARLVVGVLFLLLNVWSYKSTYDSVGDFGWFYGDFFISEDAFQQHLCYTGIYRFLNNPDAVTGYLGHYGLALISRSWTMWVLAIVSHVSQLLFLQLVEIPHMKKLYADKVRVGTPAIQKSIGAIQRVVPKPVREAAVDIIEENIKNEMKRIRLDAMKKAYALYNKYRRPKNNVKPLLKNAYSSENLQDLNKNINDNNSKVEATTASASNNDNDNNSSNSTGSSGDVNIRLECASSIEIGVPLKVNYTFKDTQARSELDWIGIYPIDVPSVPGVSEGKWMYINDDYTTNQSDNAAGDDNKNNGSSNITFPVSLMPQNEGVYEIRYHRNNEYKVLASTPIILYAPGSSPEDVADITATYTNLQGQGVSSPKRD